MKKPTYCQLWTSFRRGNWMFVDVFIECVAWSCWQTWCRLPIICNLKYFSFFVFYFNVSNKIFFQPTQAIKFAHFQPPHLLPCTFNSPPHLSLPHLLGTQEKANLNMPNFILMFNFSILDLLCRLCLIVKFGILVLLD